MLIQLVLLFSYIVIAPTSNAFADVISIVLMFYSGLFVLFSVKNSKYKSLWVLLAMMPLSWAIINTVIFYINNFIDMRLEAMSYLVYLYNISNIIMVMAVSTYFIKNISKWHRVKLILDILVMLVIVTGLASALIFSNLESSGIPLLDLINLGIYMTTDLLALSIVLVLITSTRVKNISINLYIIITSFLFYFAADMLRAVEVSFSTYVSPILVHTLFLATFTVIVIAKHVETTYKTVETKYDKEVPENIRVSPLTIWLAAIPLVLFAFGRINLAHFAIIAVAIIVYQFIGFYLNRASMAEIIIKKEQRISEELEALVEDRTRALMKMNKELTTLSIKDELTGLYNRHYFIEGLKQRIKHKDQHFSVLFMDLDRFKIINDVHGHAMGDHVLKEVADRFEKNRKNRCVYYRVGGDEFAVVCESDQIKELEQLSQQIIGLLEEPVKIDDYQFYIGISIGIARFPKDALNVGDLMKYSDIAMYHAKNSEQADKYILYSSALIDQIERRNLIELLIKNADFDRDFALYYQPKFSTESHKLVGMEALLRWYHHELGFISPGEFIPIAEESGIILELSDWVFEKAAKQIKQWNTLLNEDLVMSVNVSPLSLDSIHFIPKIENLLLENELNPKWMEFEITENSALNSAVKLEEIFTTLSGLGVWISIDDFGTGYSSLSYIKRYDVDILKIAKELIDNITTDNSDHLIVRAIIMMAKGMGLKTIAEGVETKEQYDLLKELECDAIQGYYLGKPMPAVKFNKDILNIEHE